MTLLNQSSIMIKICIFACLLTFHKASANYQTLFSATTHASSLLIAQVSNLNNEELRQKNEAKRKMQEEEMLKQFHRIGVIEKYKTIVFGFIIFAFGLTIWRRASKKLGEINKEVYEKGTPDKYEGYEKLVFHERWARLRTRIGLVMFIIGVVFIMMGIGDLYG